VDGEQGRVVIGMDPHKRSVTIEVMASDEQVLGGGRFATDVQGFAAMLAYVSAWPDRVWAIEGCEGIGGHVAQRLIAEAESVLDVPAKLSARVRVFATGQGRKTDDTDAHSIALVGVRVSELRSVVDDAQLELVRLLVDRRRRIGQEHTRMVCQLHQLLLELIPGGANLSAAQARKLLAGVRPRDLVGKTRKRHAMELVVDLERIYQRKKAANKELVEQVKTTGTGLIDLHGIGPSGAARLLVEVGEVTRFPDRGHFASWTGTAPIDASSGDRVRHRLSRGGNRQINMVLHMMAVVQLRNPTEGRTYYDRKVAAGKSPNEAMRCLKRRLSDIVYRTMLNDLVANKATGPGGHRGASRQSSAAGLHPTPTLRTSHFPDPPRTSLRPHAAPLDTEGSQKRTSSCPHQR
jgi:transposase